MSSTDAGAAPDDAELQFDHAEYDTPSEAVACVACKQPVTDTYYEINGKVFCARCRAGVEAHMAGGSGIARFLRAFLFGSAAAAAGFLLYFGVLITTGYHLGIISIVVGVMVGAAVRKGSDQRGGWVYQSLAVFLSYMAIVASFSGVLISQLISNPRPGAPPQVAAGADKAAVQGKANNADAPAPRRRANPGAEAGEGALTALLKLIVLLATMAGMLFALPIIQGVQHPITLIIVGIALWEASKLNKRVPLQFNGPFYVKPPELEELPPGGIPSHA